MKCELIRDCLFFKTQGISDQPCIVEKLKSTYCEGNPLLCARRRAAQAIGRDRVPIDLHPDHIHRAQELIAHSLHED